MKRTVLLAGNPNVGKSTVFNALTGLRQHTGNWAGKTVETAEGRYCYHGVEYRLVDLPGTYSLDTRSGEERAARQVLEAGDFDCVAVVCDGTLLRRNLILVYQLLRLRVPLVVCINLMDEAERRGLRVDLRKLSHLLGVPVVGVSAAKREGLEELKHQIRQAAEGYARPRPPEIPQSRRQRAELAEQTALAVTEQIIRKEGWQTVMDHILTGRKTAVPLMLLMLFFLLWLTVAGANVPSEYLWRAVLWGYDWLGVLLAGMPEALQSLLLEGMYLTAGQVVAVMLPPMAIFFPLFTLLEDLGYLPRVAYNLHHRLEQSGGCGKMALTMCMGLGCNAAGVTGCRIIESPRERELAVLTNSFVPCNGRFGALIFLLTAYLAPGSSGSAVAALGLLGFLVLGVGATMGVLKLLSLTLYRGQPSPFTLELPPFRKPQVGRVLLRSVLDRTLRVLGRAVLVSIPAGLVLWCGNHWSVGGVSLLGHLAAVLEPLGRSLGMSGAILTAFLLGFPANEIVLPVVVVILTGNFGLNVEDAMLASTLTAAGFDRAMALCTAMFFLFHWPCATTCLTIRKELGSTGKMLLAMALPTVVGGVLCLLLNLVLK